MRAGKDAERERSKSALIVAVVAALTMLIAGAYAERAGAAARLATTQLYDTGSPTVSTIWVDPVAGRDAPARGTSKRRPLRTIAAAWNRIPQGSTLTKGYRIMLRAGTYPESSIPTYWERRHGTQSAPIFLQSADGAGSARLTAPVNVYDTRHLYVIGVHITAGGGDLLHCERCSYLLLRDVVIRGVGDVRQSQGPQEALKVNQSDHIYIEHSDISGGADNAIDWVAVQHGHIVTSTIHRGGDWCGYVKGGSADIQVEGNEFYDCVTGGFTAGQGTGFEYMVAPWLAYETYGITIVNNIVHDTTGAAFGVNGGYDVLIAFNTAANVGARSHVLEFVFGGRSCDGDTARCQANLDAGGWGTATVGGDGEPIGNDHVWALSNIVYNPTTPSQWQQLAIYGPRTPGAGSNIPSPQHADTDLRIQGNYIANGTASMPIGIEDDSAGCRPSNPTCNEAQLRADNAFTTARSSDASTIAAGDLAVATARALAGGMNSATTTLPAMGWSDVPDPAPPEGIPASTIASDRDGVSRAATGGAPGAYAAAHRRTATVRVRRTGNGRITFDRFAVTCRKRSCTRTFGATAWVTLTAQPGPGLHFARWRGACARATNPVCVIPAGPGRPAIAVFAR